jgi:hypothetical protein
MEEDELTRIASADQAADARAQLRELESLFRTRTDPAAKQRLARQIVRMRAALTHYRLRAETRRIYHPVR